MSFATVVSDRGTWRCEPAPHFNIWEDIHAEALFPGWAFHGFFGSHGPGAGNRFSAGFRGERAKIANSRAIGGYSRQICRKF
jgi:hypothetical protein